MRKESKIKYSIRFKSTILTIILVSFNFSVTFAQCAMCRASVGSNLSEGRGAIGTGINDGILYLLLITYLSVPTLMFFWYRLAKKEQRKRQILKQFSLN